MEFPNRYSFPCPVHGGDNPEGCSIFTDGDSSKGNWSCWTQHCEEDFTSNLFGFVRGVLTQNRGRKVSLNQAADFCLKFLDHQRSQEEFLQLLLHFFHFVFLIFMI